MKAEYHKLFKLKRHMKTREPGGWNAPTSTGSQWQNTNTALHAPFFFWSLGNDDTYVVLYRDSKVNSSCLLWRPYLSFATLK